MSTSVQGDAGVLLETLPVVPTLDLVSYRSSVHEDLPEDWPKQPGHAGRDSHGQAAILHVAANRWLLCDPAPERLATCNALALKYALTDVTGKYCRFRLSGTSAGQMLAGTIDLGIVLRARDCAALPLFDCPSVLIRNCTDCGVWVERSYCTAFVMAVEQVCTSARLGGLTR
jgi:sarcosine oxidase gamma subunit